MDDQEQQQPYQQLETAVNIEATTEPNIPTNEFSNTELEEDNQAEYIRSSRDRNQIQSNPNLLTTEINISYIANTEEDQLFAAKPENTGPQKLADTQQDKGLMRLNMNFVSETPNTVLTLKQMDKEFNFEEEKQSRGRRSSHQDDSYEIMGQMHFTKEQPSSPGTQSNDRNAAFSDQPTTVVDNHRSKSSGDNLRKQDRPFTSLLHQKLAHQISGKLTDEFKDAMKFPSSRVSSVDEFRIRDQPSATVLYEPNEDMRPEIQRERAMSFVYGLRSGKLQSNAVIMIKNPARQYDTYGRLVRWKRIPAKPRQEPNRACCEDEAVVHKRKLHDEIFVRKLELYNEGLEKKLEFRRRAIANWRRLKVLLAILKLCGNQRLQIQKTEVRKVLKEPMKKKTLNEHLVKRIMLPTSKSKLSWDTFVCFIYLNSLYDDSFFFVMGLWPLTVPQLKLAQTVCSFIMLIDIWLNFFTAFEKEMRIEIDEGELEESKSKFSQIKQSIKKLSESIDEESNEKAITDKKSKKSPDDDGVYERRFTKIASRYLTSTFVFDFLACVPVLMFEASYGFTTNFKKVRVMIDSGWYWLFSLFKVFKLFQFIRILEVLYRLGNKLDAMFPIKKVLIMNMRKIMWIAIKLSLTTHILTCIFVMVSYKRIEERQIEFTLEHGEYTSPSQILSVCWYYYVESLYFTVMTQTTVGYGAPYQFTSNEMIFAMIAQFCGTALFSMIVGEVFDWNKEASVEVMVQNQKSEMEELLFVLSRTFDHSESHVRRSNKIGLEDEVFDLSLMHIDDIIRYSTKHAFHNQEFFRELPPKLRSKLINEVLQTQIKKLQFFFNDYIKNITAPKGFIESIIISLDSALFNIGDVIVESGNYLDYIYFVIQGQCHLYGFHEMRDGEVIRFPLVKLKEGSWFGDYQIMLNVRSTWDLEATKEPKDSKKITKIPTGKIHVFQLTGEKFLKIVNKYPQFRRWMLMRAKLRRCHFKKVFEENRHIYILNQKRQSYEKLQRTLGQPLNLSLDSDNQSDDIWGETISQQKLTEKELARKRMHQLLSREFHEFRQKSRAKYYDPMSLQNKVSFLSQHYTQIDGSEHEKQQLVGFNRHIQEQIFQQDRIRTFTELLFRLQLTSEIAMRTIDQWKTFFRNKWTWMGNIIQGEEADSIHFGFVSVFGLDIMRKSISGVQQVRSQSLQTVRKELNIFYNDDQEKRLVMRRLIEMINLETEDWESLVAECLKCIRSQETANGLVVYDFVMDERKLFKYGLKKTKGGSFSLVSPIQSYESAMTKNTK